MDTYERNRRRNNEDCHKRPPLFWVSENGKTGKIVRGCCNDWLCPRCGWIRANQEFKRIVEGAKVLTDEGHNLYMLTVTCKGRDMPLERAMSDYGIWTKKLNDAMRVKAKRSDSFCSFVSLVERQKRQHPHSHYLTTYCPDDAVEAKEYSMKRDNSGALVKTERNVLRSAWLAEQVKRSGLGEQYDISLVRSNIGAAKYVTKYLFKTVLDEKWPKNWKRIRYSQNWPKPEKRESNALALVTSASWDELAKHAVVVNTDSEQSYYIAKQALWRARDVLIFKPKSEIEDISSGLE